MKRNAFIELAENSRLVLMRETGMDELDYQLMILEGGCSFLDEMVRPKGASWPVPELCNLYREHLTSIGYWSFYEFLFRHLEIGMAEQWTNAQGVDHLQSAEWKRDRLIREVNALPWNPMASNQMDLWLKQLGPKTTLVVPATESKPQQVLEHAN